MNSLVKVLIIIALLGVVYVLLRIQSRRLKKKAGESRFATRRR